MNKSILNIDIQEFINNNINSNLTKLVLKGSPFKAVSIQEIAEQIEAKKRSQKKLPSWFSTSNIYFPNKLNIEQTSSEITANYKSSLIEGSSLIDITGGFGVDCYSFAQNINSITHCELNTKLSQIVTHNYKQLKINNIKTFAGDGVDFLNNTTNTFDWIYADPSRRNEAKGKVFLLNDCLPNIPENLDLLFKKTTNILLKISPILDITSAINELKFVKEIHIVAVENEVKELLFILKKNHTQEIFIKTINFNKNNKQLFNFNLDKAVYATYSKPKKYIFEPNAAILKAGGFNQISEQLNVDKLQQHSHLYTSDKLIDFPGRSFEVIHCISYDKKQLKKLIPSKKANITTRNFPETVAQIRKKTGLKDGGNQYLFFTTDLNKTKIVLICNKV